MALASLFLVLVSLAPERSVSLLKRPRCRVFRIRGGYDKYSSEKWSDPTRMYGLDDGWNSEAYVEGYEYEPAPARRRDDVGDFFSQLPVPDRKTGLIMCAAGAAFTMLGVSLFFEKNLIRLGNILLVVGASIVVGPKRASAYVLDPNKLRGTLVFAFGFFLILSGHPLLGTLTELFGFFNLFGNLFPILGAMIARLPLMNSLAGLGGGGPPPANQGLDPRDFMNGFAGNNDLRGDTTHLY